jgi:hypothetical protein
MKGDAVLAALSPQEKAAYSPEDHQKLIGKEALVVLVFGTRSLTTLRDALVSSVEYVQRSRSALTLPPSAGLSAVDPKNLSKGAIVVIDAAGAAPSFPALCRGGASLTPDGVGAVFGDSVSTSPDALSQFDLVETRADGSARVYRQCSDARSAYSLKPVAYAVVVRETSGALPAVARLSAATAAALTHSPTLVSGSVALNKESQRAALSTRLGSSIPAYSVNAAVLSSEEVSRALAAIADGSALSATLTPLKDLDAGAVTKVKGIDDTKLAAPKDKAAIQALAKLLA